MKKFICVLLLVIMSLMMVSVASAGTSLPPQRPPVPTTERSTA